MNKRIMYYERDIKKEIRTSIKKMCVTPENTEPWLLDALFPTMRMFLENDFLEKEEENQEARNKMDTCYSLDFDMSSNPEDLNTARRLLTLLLGNEDAKKMLCCQYQWMLQRNENNILSPMEEQKEKAGMKKLAKEGWLKKKYAIFWKSYNRNASIHLLIKEIDTIADIEREVAVAADHWNIRSANRKTPYLEVNVYEHGYKTNMTKYYLIPLTNLKKAKKTNDFIQKAAALFENELAKSF